MKNLKFTVTYFENGIKKSASVQENDLYKIDYSLSDNSFKAKILPKKEISLYRIDVKFDYKFEDNSKFYCNGYQAWTTSREMAKSEKMKDVIFIAVNQKLKNLAGVSGDSRFVKVPKNAGEFYSHTYTYIRNGENVDLFGSLTERQGFTVIYGDMNNNTLTFSKDVEGVTVKDEYDLFDMFMTSGNYNQTFDDYFSQMGLKKPRIDRMSGYTSWYNYFQEIDEKIIIRDLNAMDKFKESVTVFQIDDGYETFVGDWLDPNPSKFPKGMKYVAEEIHKKGYKAGIWLAPFSLQKASRMFKEHKDWVICENGKPLKSVVAWGGAYAMDIYNKDAREYIKHFFDVILNDWGYDMVKLDFLYSQCILPRNNKSRGTIMCEAMEFLRECCGDKIILGCGVPLGAAFGYVDACRISCDVDLTYKGKYYNFFHVNNEVPSAQNAINNSIYRRHLDGRAFLNDPDVFFLRYSNLKFSMEQKKLLGEINHLFGNVLFVSDNAEEYKESDTELVKKFFASPTLFAENVERNGEDFEIILNDGSSRKKLNFNLKTGAGNIEEIIK